MNTPLAELVRAINRFNDETSSVSWSQFPWLFNQLSWHVRMLVRCHIAQQWWKDQHLFPILLEMATPHLVRYSRGQWKYFEEENLQALFSFFQSRNDQFSSDLSFFLSKTPPSFAHERSKCQQQYGKHYGTLSWFRDETFSHYEERIHTLLRKQQKTALPPLPAKGHVEKPQLDLMTPHTQKRAEEFINQAGSQRSQIVNLVDQVEHELKNGFPLRLEAEQPIAALQLIKESTWHLLSRLDNLLTHVPDPAGTKITETALRKILSEAEEARKDIQMTLETHAAQLQQTKLCIDDTRAFVQKQLQLLSRSIDKIPMLPAANPLRAQETRLLKVAREKVKRFRTSLSKGPGPGLSVQELTNEINVLLELSTSFHEEGSEVESLRQHTVTLAAQVEKLLSTEANGSKIAILRGIRTEIAELLQTLEVSPERKHRLDKIVHAISEVTLA